ncbi:hypothetical protein D9758_006964 [Tetrapyrgos nigripes]|uniref:Uncharacterized protein n=1 Tax=Tetrapyrgos nigripes TaxID=182062 RepID=A0A8H5LUU1_9AGAR|nr:hypothetical protein D9758_006964 [Tetrapyrgos nigripes]
MTITVMSDEVRDGEREGDVEGVFVEAEGKLKTTFVHNSVVAREYPPSRFPSHPPTTRHFRYLAFHHSRLVSPGDFAFFLG